MGLNDINFTLGQGGLNRPLPGEDYKAGIIFYNSGTLPSGFQGTGNSIKQIFQTSDAESLGIVSDYSDETQATGTFLVTTAGTDGDIITINVSEPLPNGGTNIIPIGTYKKVTADSTVALVAAGIMAAINLDTLSTGYSATLNTATVTITARKGLGVFLNTGTPITVVKSSGATIAGTLTQFTGGVASLFAVYHYHISEFFRIMNSVSGQGNLWVGFFSAPNVGSAWTELASMQSSANNSIRQIAIYNDQDVFATSAVQGLQAAEALLDAEHTPFSILYTANFAAATLSTLSDLSGLSSSKVSVIIGQDGAALGWSLFKAYSKSITCIGACLGAVSAASVSEDIAATGIFNLSDGTELDTAAFANGVLFRDSSVSTGLLTQIDNQRYIFIRKFNGPVGTFFNDSHCAIAINSDYAYIENNRTIDKAKREMYVSVFPLLNSKNRLNKDGTLSTTAITVFKNSAESPLAEMGRDGDLSDYQVTVDATQNVASTSTVKINALLLPEGVARHINITIGYTSSLT